MHVFYITLSGSKPDLLSDSALPSTTYGVDMRNVRPNQLSTTTLSLAARTSLLRGRDKHEDIPSMGAIGCALSHYQCWMHIVKHKLAYAYVFEADAAMNDSLKFIEIEQYVSKQLAEGYDYISLGYRKQPALLPKKVHADHLHTFIQTHAQVVSHRGAQILLNHFFPIEMQVDGYIACLSRSNIIKACGRQFFVQNAAMSSTTHKLRDVLNFKTHCPREVTEWAIVLIVLVMVYLAVN